jgi:RNase P/RNase MRP subunit p29
MFQSRTHTCGELRLSHAGETVTITGWLENVREVGANFAFLVLRDYYGTTQVVVETAEMMQIIKGINKVIALPFKGLNAVLDTIAGVSIAGIEPFSWLTWRAPVPEIPLLERGGVLEKGQVGLLEGNGAEAVVPLEKNKKWLARVAEQLSRLLVDDLGGLGFERSIQNRASTISPAVVALEGLPSKLDRILEAIEKGQILTIDGNALVGATSNRMDSALGRRRDLAARGAI